jgi:hypothetical protein
LIKIYEACGLDQPLALQVAEALMKKDAFRGALAMVLTACVDRFFFILFQIVETVFSGRNVFLTNVWKLLPEETFYSIALFLKVVVCDAGRVGSVSVSVSVSVS